MNNSVPKWLNGSDYSSVRDLALPPILQIPLIPPPTVRSELLDYFHEVRARSLSQHPVSIYGFTGDKNHIDQSHLDPRLSWLIKNLKHEVNRYVTDYILDNVPYSIYLQKAWPVLLVSGQSIKPHAHNSSDLSLVYYVQTPDTSIGGNLVFTNPVNLFPSINPCIQHKRYFRTGVAPFSGLLLIFPSSLVHEVTEYTADAPRFSLSFDFSITQAKETPNYQRENLLPPPSQWTPFT